MVRQVLQQVELGHDARRPPGLDGHQRRRAGAQELERLVNAGSRGGPHHWLNTHRLKSIKIQERGHRLVRQIQQRDVGKYTKRIVSFVEGAAISIGKTLFSVVLLIVVTIYMLLDMQRFGRVIDRRFPPRRGEMSLLRSIEHALASYVKGQAALSFSAHAREKRSASAT